MTEKLEAQLAKLDERLTRLESMMASLLELAESQRMEALHVIDQIKGWVTQFVAMRLQQLVPESCEHVPAPEVGGPYLDGTTIPCTDEVAHRVARIPIPFVRQMVAQKVADQARKDQVSRIDVAYFEKAATF